MRSVPLSFCLSLSRTAPPLIDSALRRFPHTAQRPSTTVPLPSCAQYHLYWTASPLSLPPPPCSMITFDGDPAAGLGLLGVLVSTSFLGGWIDSRHISGSSTYYHAALDTVRQPRVLDTRRRSSARHQRRHFSLSANSLAYHRSGGQDDAFFFLPILAIRHGEDTSYNSSLIRSAGGRKRFYMLYVCL